MKLYVLCIPISNLPLRIRKSEIIWNWWESVLNPSEIFAKLFIRNGSGFGGVRRWSIEHPACVWSARESSVIFGKLATSWWAISSVLIVLKVFVCLAGNQILVASWGGFSLIVARLAHGMLNLLIPQPKWNPRPALGNWILNRWSPEKSLPRFWGEVWLLSSLTLPLVLVRIKSQSNCQCNLKNDEKQSHSFKAKTQLISLIIQS